MRAELQALIDYTGLSHPEAAHIIGIGVDALTRKLKGADKYPVRESDLAPLADVALYQDEQVGAVLTRLRSLRASATESDEIVLISYRLDADLPTDDRYPFASVTRMIAARIALAKPAAVKLISFDRGRYTAWLGARIDSRSLRQEWAAIQAQDTRLSFKMGYDSDGHKIALGWAVWKTGGLPKKLKDGEG